MTKKTETNPDISTNQAETALPSDKKGRPTPKRAEQEAARRHPIVGNKALNKEQRKANQEKLRAAREKARIGMANGEDKYLTPRDKGPQRRFVRDWIDARFSIGELVVPGIFVIIFAMSFPNETVSLISIVTLWVLVALTVLDMFWIGRSIAKRVEQKFGPGSMQKGTKWYAAMRSAQMRFLRMPKALTKYGNWPT